MEDTVQQGLPRRRKPKLAPWEKALRRYWPPIRLVFAGLIVILLLVLIISIVIGFFI